MLRRVTENKKRGIKSHDVSVAEKKKAKNSRYLFNVNKNQI